MIIGEIIVDTNMIAIIKYNAGNVQSVQHALHRLNTEAVITDDTAVLLKADKVIFPGVGHAGAAMASLRSKGLDEVIMRLRQPVLGICVGMQLLCSHSAEGDTKGLGIFDAEVCRFDHAVIPGTLKIPQTGWNTIYDYRSPLFAGLADDAFVYYVHSYYATPGADTIAKSDYGLTYSAALQKDNFYAVQFHAEKSATIGETILNNFLSM